VLCVAQYVRAARKEWTWYMHVVARRTKTGTTFGKCLFVSSFMVCTAHYNYSDSQVNTNEMGVACGTYGGEDRCLQIFLEETLYKRPLERSRRRWKYVIKMGLYDVGCVVMY
jgi:hypothetical protein